MKIDIRGLSKRFDQTPVLRDVNLVVDEGEFFFILGPSGCGKTTLLRILAGFESPSDGDVLFNDRSIISTPPNRRNIGMVFQNYALWPHMTVMENVRFGLDIKKTPATEIRERVMEVLDMVHLSGYEDRLPNQLSGGQQQRVALARALVTRPGILLLDEPLSNLDARLRLEMRDELLRVQKATGITTIYVTHDQKEALSMADRMIILKNGRLIQQGSPFQIYRFPADAFVAQFMGETNFIPATVTAQDGEWVTTDSSLGPLIGTAGNRRFQPGEEVRLSIRPEAIQPTFSSAPAGTNTFRARVEKTVFLGEFEHFWLQNGDTFFKMLYLNPTPDLHRTGVELPLAVKHADTVVLPSDGEDNER